MAGAQDKFAKGGVVAETANAAVGDKGVPDVAVAADTKTAEALANGSAATPDIAKRAEARTASPATEKPAANPALVVASDKEVDVISTGRSHRDPYQDKWFHSNKPTKTKITSWVESQIKAGILRIEKAL